MYRQYNKENGTKYFAPFDFMHFTMNLQDFGILF